MKTISRVAFSALSAVVAAISVGAAPPIIQSFAPSQGTVGTYVRVAGEGFSPEASENLVRFGSLRAIVTAATSTSLVARVPLHAGVQPITVTRDGLTAVSRLAFVPTFLPGAALDTNSFSQPIALASQRTPHGIVGDVDGDGWLDLIFANYHEPSVSLWRNSAAGTSVGSNTFPLRLDLPTGSGPHTPALADFDGDGRLDMVIPNDFSANVSVYRNRGSPGVLTAESFAERVNFSTHNNPVYVRPADIDGDGKPDLVVVNAVLGPSTVSVHRNVATPGTISTDSFAAGVHSVTGRHSFWADVGDLDGDGKPDVVVANVEENTLSVLRNRSTPGAIDASSLEPAFVLPLPARAQNAVLVDLDGDGRLDIAANGDNATYLLRNIATPGALNAASFAPVQSLPAGGVELKVADFDGDGRPDLAGTPPGSPSQILIHLNLSAPGLFAFAPPIALRGEGERFDVGDLNGDGSPDLVAGRDQARGSGMFLVQNLIPVRPPATGDSPPDIVAQPSMITAVRGTTAPFSVRVLGAEPLAYQWHFNGSPISDGTNRLLILTNVTFAQAGPYQVVITNPFGAATSSVATLTVVPPPATVRAVDVESPAGTIVVPIELSANGNENALAFSLQFSSGLFAFVEVRPGADATGASLVVNTNSKGQGSIGVTITRLPGETFEAGTRRVAGLVLRTLPVITTDAQRAAGPSQGASVAFSDTPVPRRLTDASGEPLPVTFQNGTVKVQTSSIQAGTVETATGGSVRVPIRLAALGTENALSCSVAFSPQLLALTGAGPDANLPPGAALIVNTNQLAAGRVGLSVALPAGQAFPAGSNDVLFLEFDVATVTQPQATSLTFVDTPVLRQLADVDAQRIPAVFQAGRVAIVTIAFEGDAAPRPGGDHTLSVIDWVQVGRFAAGLEAPAPGEFQRADCAPRDSRGNGIISVADWVQAGRYASNLDPLTGVGGPESPAEPALRAAQLPPAPSSVIQANDTHAPPGSIVELPISITGAGHQNALGFSLSFDPSRLRFLDADTAAAAAGAALNLNTNDAPGGRLGLALALPPGTTVPAGTAELVRVRFAVEPGDSGFATVSFADTPIPGESVNALAGTMSTTFVGARITIGPDPSAGPVLHITRSGAGVVVDWLAASGFELYSAEWPDSAAWTKVAASPVRIGDQSVVTLPISDDRKYFRLQKP